MATRISLFFPVVVDQLGRSNLFLVTRRRGMSSLVRRRSQPRRRCGLGNVVADFGRWTTTTSPWRTHYDLKYRLPNSLKSDYDNDELLSPPTCFVVLDKFGPLICHAIATDSPRRCSAFEHFTPISPCNLRLHVPQIVAFITKAF